MLHDPKYSFALCLTAALLLCGCGTSNVTTDSSVTAEVPVFVEEAEETAEPEAAASPAPNEKAELAKTLIDHPVAELYEAVGEPESSEYAHSCLGPGDDGSLYYDGFTVATYREGDSETVRDVLE